MNYIEEAHLTASPHFHGDKVPLSFFADTLKEAIEALQKLDRIKKTLFYGRDLPDVAKVAKSTPDVSKLPDWISDNADDDAAAVNIIHGIIGAATEAGELLEALYASAIDDKPFDSVNMGEEVGDVFWYFALLAKACNFTFDESQRVNIAKLRMRYGEKFSEFDANNRNLTAERSILENGRSLQAGENRNELYLTKDYEARN
jgi:NTP pyrophosphatase (non-canonical NTP hydrolase)